MDWTRTGLGPVIKDAHVSFEELDWACDWTGHILGLALDWAGLGQDWNYRLPISQTIQK